MEKEGKLDGFIKQGGGSHELDPKCWLMFFKVKMAAERSVVSWILSIWFVNSDSLILRLRNKLSSLENDIFHNRSNVYFQPHQIQQRNTVLISRWLFRIVIAVYAKQHRNSQKTFHIYPFLSNVPFSMLYASGIFPNLYHMQSKRRRK